MKIETDTESKINASFMVGFYELICLSVAAAGGRKIFIDEFRSTAWYAFTIKAITFVNVATYKIFFYY